jgi:hypothetical protein
LTSNEKESQEKKHPGKNAQEKNQEIREKSFLLVIFNGISLVGPGCIGSPSACANIYDP